METLEIWEFTDHHPSGQHVRYQLELRDNELSLHSNDPSFNDRRAEFSGDQVLIFLKYLICREAGEKCSKASIEQVLWRGAKDPGIVNTYLAKLRKLLNDDSRSNKRGDVLGGRIIQSHKKGYLVFTPKVHHTQHARIEKTARFDLFSSIPRLHNNFVERPEISEVLIEKLCSGMASGEGIAIEGIGGAGKTTLATAVCHDPRVRQAFPDGIVWQPFGHERPRKLEERIEETCSFLNQEFRVYNEVALQTLLKDKAVLLVLDDIWSMADVAPFLLYGGRSRVLFTTRDKTLAGPLGIGANAIEVGQINPIQARSVLAKWAGCGDNLPEPQASDLIKQCDRLPLALAMIGAMLATQSGEEKWTSILGDLKRAKLKYIGSSPAGYHYETLHSAIAVGVESLPTEYKLRYLKLAALLEDVPAATEVLQSLWSPDLEEVRRTRMLFGDRSLGTYGQDGFRIHDLQMKYIRGEYQYPETLSLLHAALRRSLHVVVQHPGQFFSQMTGRLLDCRDEPGIEGFLEDLAANSPRPRLRPLRPALSSAKDPSSRILLNGELAAVQQIVITDDNKRALVRGRGVAICDLAGDRPTQIPSDSSTRVVPRKVAVTKDGAVAVATGLDNEITIWDLKGGAPPKLLQGSGIGAFTDCVAIDSMDRFAIVGSNSGTLIVWDLVGQCQAAVLQGHNGAVTVVVCERNAQRAISASVDGTVIVWNLETFAIDGILTGHKTGVSALAVADDGKRALSGAKDGTIILWDIEQFKPVHNWHYRKTAVSQLALSADSKRALSSHVSDNAVALWNLASDEAPYLLEGHNPGAEAYDIAISSDGKWGISGSNDRSLILWNLDQAAQSLILQGHTSLVTSLALSADNTFALSGDDNGTVIKWDLTTRHAPVLRHKRPISAVATLPNGKRAVSVSSREPSVILWDLDCQPSARQLGFHEYHCVARVAVTPDGNFAISGSDDGELLLWDLSGNEPGITLSPGRLRWDKLLVPFGAHTGHEGPITAIAVSPDGKYAVSGSYDRNLIVWNLERHELSATLTGHADAITCIAISPDSRFVISGSRDHTLMVWDLEYDQVRVLEGHSNEITSVAATSDGRYAISSSADHTLRLWDLHDLLPPRILEGHRKPVRFVRVSDDGRHAVSYSEDYRFGLWDLQKMAAGRFVEAPGPCLFLTADCRYAVTGFWNQGAITLFDLAGGAPTGEAFTCDGEIEAFADVPGMIVIGDYRGEVHFLKIEV